MEKVKGSEYFPKALYTWNREEEWREEERQRRSKREREREEEGAAYVG